MPAKKSVTNVRMARKRTRERPSLNPRRSDPEAARAQKLARLQKELGPVNTALGRTRQETHKRARSKLHHAITGYAIRRLRGARFDQIKRKET